MADTAKKDGNYVSTLLAVSNADGSTPVLLEADPTTHALLVSASITSTTTAVYGTLTNNNAAPTSNNIGSLTALANAAAPSYTEGRQVLLSTDLAGALRVTGSLSVGGTTDNSAFTAGTSTGTPAMGFYHSTIDTVTDGRSAALGMTSKRAMFVNLQNSSGTEIATVAAPLYVAISSTTNTVTLSAETTKVIGTVRMLGNVGAVVDGVNTAATAPANGVLGLGIYNSTEPSPTTGQSVGIQLDAKGRARQVIMDAAGNTRGANVTAANALTVDGSGVTQPVSYATTGSGTATGALRVELANNGTGVMTSIGSITSSIVPGTGATNLGKAEDASHTSGDTGVFILGVRNDTILDRTTADNEYAPISTDGAGRVLVNIAPTTTWITGNISLATTTSTQVIAAAGAGVRNFITGVQISNTGSTATLITFQDGSGGTTLGYTIAPAGGGSNITYQVPIKTSSNTAFFVACASTSTSVYISAQGYKAN